MRAATTAATIAARYSSARRSPCRVLATFLRLAAAVELCVKSVASASTAAVSTATKRTTAAVSTGAASINEITEAVQTARKNGAEEILLFHCISSYPAPAKEALAPANVLAKF